MIEIDSQTAPALWKTGDSGRPSRPTITRQGAPGGLLLVELDCGHTFLMDGLPDGWAEVTYSCPLEHVVIQARGGPVREVAPRVFERMERCDRARRLGTDPLLFMEMEDVLRADPWACDEPDAEECAAPRDGESDPCWEHRRRKLLDRLGR